MNLYCPWEPAQYFIFSANVPSVLYYAMLPGMIVSLLIGFYLLAKKKDDLSVHSLVGMFLLFSIWGSFNLLLFATNSPREVMFFWSLTILVEPTIYLMGVLFTYRFLYNKDLSFAKLVLLLLPLLPIIVFLSTNLNLEGVNLSDCTAIEGPIAQYYTYLIEIIYSIVLLYIVALRYYKETDKLSRNKILYLGIGILLFFISFSSGNIIGSFTNDWVTSQYGYFGMPIFVGFLAYIMVRYKAFDIKLLGAQALIVSLVVLIGSEFFFIQNTTNQILTAITLIITGVIGLNLIRSVKKEVAQREHIELLAQGLEVANKGQENLIHVMNHQIKGYLGTARNIFAELSQSNDYGQMPEASMPLLTKGLEEMGAGVEYVQQILKGASAHSGTLPYDMRSIDLKSLVTNLVSKQKEVAEKAGLMFESHIVDGDYMMTGDATLLEEAFKNLITNAIKYNNPNGSISITLSRTDGKILFGVKDTGRGILKEDEPKLFKPGGVGKDSIRFNVESSGFGLAFVKPVVEKHQGRVWYETEVGKGTTFFVELPVGQITK